MSSFIVQIKRWQGTDMVVIRSRASDAPEADKEFIRPIDYNIFERTCIPADYRLRSGALVSLILLFPKRDVQAIELRAFGNGPLWAADALVDDGDTVCRGVGATPVDALASLAIDIQLY